MDRVWVLAACLAIAALSAFATSWYVHHSLLLKEKFKDSDRMHQERLKTAISDGFQAKLKRQPTPEEVDTFMDALLEQVRGAALRKDDLIAIVANLIEAKKIQ